MESSKAILVTGASTGIGRNITERIAALGYFVYAGARKEADLAALAAINNVHPLRLDVTNPREIARAVQIVQETSQGLYGLVNNAGIVTLGTVVDMSDREFDLVMAVNVYGPLRLAKAFAPLITRARGRIVMIGSITGFFADKDHSAYSMSKHAIEALTDSLALEMKPVGVHVSVVEPGNFDTAIVRNAAARSGADPDLGDRSRYRKPEEVATAVALALFAERPSRRYLVVPNQEEAALTIKAGIARLVQINRGHAYSYNRNALVQMIDDELGMAED